MAEQNFANHTRLVPLFHFFVLPVLLINIGRTIYHWYLNSFSLEGFFTVLLAVALFVLAGTARTFALRVQDRVIRLEEQLRCQRLLPADLQPRIGELSINQLVSLRFASDAELPALARKVLDEKLTERKAIKQLVKSWRPDYARA
jgi:Family of unknown function (DUF6526)